MYDAVDAYDRTLAHMGAVEDGDAGCDQHLFLDGRTGHVGMRADQTVIADAARVTRASTHHRVLHHDDVATDADRTARFADDAGTVKHPRARRDLHIAADRGVGCDPSGRIDARCLPGM